MQRHRSTRTTLHLPCTSVSLYPLLSTSRSLCRRHVYNAPSLCGQAGGLCVLRRCLVHLGLLQTVGPRELQKDLQPLQYEITSSSFFKVGGGGGGCRERERELNGTSNCFFGGFPMKTNTDYFSSVFPSKLSSKKVLCLGRIHYVICVHHKRRR